MKNPASHRFSETNMTPQKLVRRSFAALFAVLLMVFASSTAAQAHDSVVSTAPVDQSSVTTVPEQVQITMSNNPIVIGTNGEGSLIEVVDETGTNWALGSVQVLDKVATQQIRPGAPAGKYTVKWRLVSADGHPVEQEFTFTASSASTATSAANVGAGPAVSVQAQPQSTPENAPDDSAVPWSVIGLGIVLVGLVIALLVVARRRLGKES